MPWGTDRKAFPRSLGRPVTGVETLWELAGLLSLPSEVLLCSCAASATVILTAPVPGVEGEDGWVVTSVGTRAGLWEPRFSVSMVMAGL